ncbi:hypothetical protein [Dokdonella immobilis]|uniref:Uncharacterized protein n=1 Tax=Dokdonella immobilis TaxID=578942 RepID=A0A1I4W1N5_9GAMM|nr:hypothetical protein [Dokdonella immobilis]SFN07474.1 hypothetical protein SAMN05216289_103275 [Dokdonella immobilis]
MEKISRANITSSELRWSFGAFFVMGFFLGGIFFADDGWIVALAKNPDAPEWAQGIGSLVAIAIAIYVPWKQRQNEAADRAAQDRRQARAIAAMLRAPLDEWIDSFHSFEQNIDRSDVNFSNGQLIRCGSVGSYFFGTSKTIERHIEQLYLLGTAGDRIFDALRKAHEARALCESLLGEIGYSQERDNEVYRSDQFRMIWDRYSSIQNDIGEAIDIVVELL